MISATELRGNLYKFLDEVLETGKPLEIRRNGQILKIVAESVKPKANKLLNLKKRQGVISCTHEELITSV